MCWYQFLLTWYYFIVKQNEHDRIKELKVTHIIQTLRVSSWKYTFSRGNQGENFHEKKWRLQKNSLSSHIAVKREPARPFTYFLKKKKNHFLSPRKDSIVFLSFLTSQYPEMLLSKMTSNIHRICTRSSQDVQATCIESARDLRTCYMKSIRISYKSARYLLTRLAIWIS